MILRPLALLVTLSAPLQAQELATYWANSGSLPPEYAWEVNVTILASGKVTLTHCKGYVTEGPGCTTRTGKANAAQIEAIRLAAAESGLIATPAREAPPEEIPIGGGASGGSVTIDGQTIQLMAYPRAEDAPRVAKLLSVVRAAIPERLVKRYIEGN